MRLLALCLSLKITVRVVSEASAVTDPAWHLCSRCLPLRRCLPEGLGTLGDPYPGLPGMERNRLGVVGAATRDPEAPVLSDIEAETVATARFIIFSRLGFPREILLDRGANFMSEVFKK